MATSVFQRLGPNCGRDFRNASNFAYQTTVAATPSSAAPKRNRGRSWRQISVQDRQQHGLHQVPASGERKSVFSRLDPQWHPNHPQFKEEPILMEEEAAPASLDQLSAPMDLQYEDEWEAPSEATPMEIDS